MLKRIAYIILFTTICLGSNILSGQDNWMIHMPTVHQTYINPAYQTSKKWEVSAASVGLDFQLGNVNASDFISKNNEGVNIISLEKLATALGKNNEVGMNGSFNSLDVAFRWRGFTVTAGHGINYEFATTLNPTLVDIAARGNADYIGKTVELGMPASATVYQKFYLGLAGKLANLSWGVRAGYLNGWHHMHTEKMSSQLTTEADYYNITLKNDIEIYNAGIFEYNAIDEITWIKGINDYRSFFTANHGFSLDLGLDLKLTETAGIFASAQNLGSITWADRAQKLTNQSTTLLKGIDLEKIIDGEDNSSFEDTLLQAFSMQQQNTEFSRKVAPRYNVGAYFTFSGTQFSAVFNLKQLSDINQPSVFLQASRPVIPWLNIGVNYHWREGVPFNLGLLLNSKLGPVNLFGACNNAWALLKPAQINGLSGRIGASIGL